MTIEQMSPKEAYYLKFKYIANADKKISIHTLINILNMPEIFKNRLVSECPHLAPDEYFEDESGNIELENKVNVELPRDDRLISEFAKDVGEILVSKDEYFYQVKVGEIVEITKDEKGQSNLKPLTPERFISSIEKHIQPIIKRSNPQGIYVKKKSLTYQDAKIVLNSEQFQNKINPIKMILPFPMPCLKGNKIIFPKKKYDKDFCSWLSEDSPNTNLDMKLEDAKELLNKIHKEFCFEKPNDMTNAIASLITPACRLFYDDKYARTPAFFWKANRERAGKDYGAHIRTLVYSGVAEESSPISSGKGGEDGNELRKKLISMLRSGKIFFHSANNKGHLSSAVFESFLTASQITDRILGKSELLNLSNPLEISLSGNVGISYSADLRNRCKFINLFLEIENANSRTFETPNLHSFIKKNRGLILSAIFSLIKNWVDDGCPSGKIPFTSFPEWSRVVGGIMESAGYNNPCSEDSELLNIYGDSETQDFKNLFEMIYEKHPNKWLTKQQIKDLVKDNDENLFGYYDFDKKGDQTKFALKFFRYVGRILSDIKMSVRDSSVRSSRQRFKLSKIMNKGGNLGNLGNPNPIPTYENEKIYNSSKSLPTLPTLPKTDQKPLNLPQKDKKPLNLTKSELLTAGYDKHEIINILNLEQTKQ